MNLSTHIAIGSAVGYLFRNPAAGFVAGVLSHHIIDQVPHSDGGSLNVNVKDFASDKRILAIVGFDLILMIIIAYFIYQLRGFHPAIIAGAIGGALPDLIDNMPFWTPKLRKIYPFSAYHRFHEKFHFTIEEKRFFWLGILSQILLIILAFEILI